MCLFHLQNLLHSDLCQTGLTEINALEEDQWLLMSVPSSYTDINECNEAEKKREDLCGGKGTCKNVNGSYWCKCPNGYTNYGNDRTPCSGQCSIHSSSATLLLWMFSIIYISILNMHFMSFMSSYYASTCSHPPWITFLTQTSLEKLQLDIYTFTCTHTHTHARKLLLGNDNMRSIAFANYSIESYALWCRFLYLL